MVFDPTGKKIKEVFVNGKKVTCPAWGGRDYDMIFITSSKGWPIPTEEVGDEGGNLFRFKDETGAKGTPKHLFAG